MTKHSLHWSPRRPARKERVATFPVNEKGLGVERNDFAQEGHAVMIDQLVFASGCPASMYLSRLLVLELRYPHDKIVGSAAEITLGYFSHQFTRHGAHPGCLAILRVETKSFTGGKLPVMILHGLCDKGVSRQTRVTTDRKLVFSRLTKGGCFSFVP